MKNFLLNKKILFWFVGVTVFGFPFFFLISSPLQLGIDNYSKYFLQGTVSILLLLLFFIQEIYQGKIILRQSPLDFIILLLLASLFLSSIFSPNRFISFAGNLENTSLPFFGFLFLSLFYFFVVNFFNKERSLAILKVLLFLFLFFIPIIFVIVFFYPAHAISVYLRLAFGTAGDVSFYLVYFIILFSSLLSSTNLRKKIFKNKRIIIVYNILLVLAVGVLAVVNFLYAWWLLLLGAVLLFINRIIFFKLETWQAVTYHESKEKTKKSKRRLFAPIIFAFFAINFLLSSYLVSGFGSFNERLVQHRQLNNFQSWKIAKNILTGPSFLLGAGLENFDYVYSKYRTKEMNNNKYWDVRYNKAGSFFVLLLISGGLMVAILLIVTAILLFYYYFRLIFRAFGTEEQKRKLLTDKGELTLALAPVIIVFVIGFFLFSTTANALFLFVLLLGIFLRAGSDLFFDVFGKCGFFTYNRYELDCQNNKNQKIFIYFVFGFFLVFSLVYLVFGAKLLKADIVANDLIQREDNLKKSSLLSPKRYQYNLELAKIMAKKSKDSTKKEDLDQALKYQRQSIEYLRLARDAGRNSVVVQETAGMIYRDFSEGNDGYNQMANKVFYLAFSLEPSNPVIATELGKTLLKAMDYKQAESYFRQALDLKNNYYPAKLGLAEALEQEGQKKEALKILENLSKTTKDPVVYYKLGLLYFNEGDIDKAQKSFNVAVTISPLYSNALFGLALTLEKTGEKKQALYYFKKIQRLNPANQEVVQKIKDLEEEK